MSDVLDRPAPLPDAVVRYAEHPDGILDLHLPAGEPRGMLLLVHGGFWRAEYDRRHTRPMATDLRDRGWLVATPEYRRTGAGGGWPATFDDVRRAAERLPELLAGLGLLPAREPATVPRVVLGHSAGGHLALWLAAHGLGGDRVVALAPVGDLRDAAARRLGGGAVQALLGGEPGEVPERYDAADPAGLLRAADPGCDLVIVHGDADDRVPVANSAWAEPLPHVDLRVQPDVDHFAVIDPASPAWREVVRAVEGD